MCQPGAPPDCLGNLTDASGIVNVAAAATSPVGIGAAAIIIGILASARAVGIFQRPGDGWSEDEIKHLLTEFTNKKPTIFERVIAQRLLIIHRRKYIRALSSVPAAYLKCHPAAPR